MTEIRRTPAQIRALPKEELELLYDEASSYRIAEGHLQEAYRRELDRREADGRQQVMVNLTWATTAMAAVSTVFVVLAAAGVV